MVPTVTTEQELKPWFERQQQVVRLKEKQNIKQEQVHPELHQWAQTLGDSRCLGKEEKHFWKIPERNKVPVR